MGMITTGAPLDKLATDNIGPFPRTPRGNRCILVLTDCFSKYVEVIPVPDQTAETCATKIFKEFIARWGCSLAILSDKGKHYESNVFRELCKLLEVRELRISPHNPRCNSQTEIFNRTLIRMIKAYLCGEQEDWDLNLGSLAGAYRATRPVCMGLKWYPMATTYRLSSARCSLLVKSLGKTWSQLLCEIRRSMTRDCPPQITRLEMWSGCWQSLDDPE